MAVDDLADLFVEERCMASVWKPAMKACFSSGFELLSIGRRDRDSGCL